MVPFCTFHVENEMSYTYTYEQALTYEVARDLLNTYVADCSAQLGIERAASVPNVEKIAKIHAMQQSILLERNKMTMTDDEAMRTVVAKYRRIPGANVLPESMG
jgi:hypothetical protein